MTRRESFPFIVGVLGLAFIVGWVLGDKSGFNRGTNACSAKAYVTVPVETLHCATGMVRFVGVEDLTAKFQCEVQP